MLSPVFQSNFSLPSCPYFTFLLPKMLWLQSKLVSVYIHGAQRGCRPSLAESRASAGACRPPSFSPVLHLATFFEQNWNVYDPTGYLLSFSYFITAMICKVECHSKAEVSLRTLQTTSPSLQSSTTQLSFLEILQNPA